MKGDSKVIKIIHFEGMTNKDVIFSELSVEDTLEYIDSIRLNFINNDIKIKRFRDG